MAWSTRELAELAGTTVNTVRHYHRLGLMDEPERRSNGYKQYGARDLVRLLRIRRLADLGVPLSQLDAVDDESAADVLRSLDAELAARIAHLQRARDDLATILREQVPLDVPPGFASVAERLSPADRSLVTVYTRLYDEAAMDDLRSMIDEESTVASDLFTALPEDADETTRAAVAELLARDIARQLDTYPWLTAPQSHLAQSEAVARQAFIAAAVELYNAAQQDVLLRAGIRAQELRAGPVADDEAGA